MSYSVDQILRLYSQVSQASSRIQRDQANKEIFNFIESVQAWQIAIQLLTSDRSQQDKFIGAQILFKKLECHFDQIEAKDSQILEVRDKLFQILPSTFDKKVVLDRLCMAIALLAVYTCYTCWTTSVEDIVKMGSENAEKCFVSLLILKHIASMHNTHCHEKKQRILLERNIRENLEMVQGYFAKILNQKGLPVECYYQALSAANYWCKFSTLTFVTNQAFISCLFQLLHSDLFSKTAKIFRTLLSTSKHAKAVQHYNFEVAVKMQDYTPDDQQFIQTILQTLFQLKQKFLEHPLTQQFSEDLDDDPSSAFPRKYVGLLVCLCSNYEPLLLNNDVAPQLFQLLKDCAQISNLRLCVQSLDFWTDFKETMAVCKLCSNEILLTQYKQVSQILLSQSLLLPHIAYDQLQPEEVEELEVTEKGISIKGFRDYVSEILLKTYLLLQSEYKEQGEQVIYQMLSLGLQEGIQANKADQLEVCFFGLRSIYDGFDDSNWNQATLSILETFFSFIATKGTEMEACFILQRACLQTIAELSSGLKEFKQLLLGQLQFCFKAVTNERLRKLAIEAVLAVCESCHYGFGELEIRELFGFLQNTYAIMSCEHSAKLVKAATIIASVQEDQILFTAITEIAKLPLQHLLSPQSDRNQQLKSLLALKAMVFSLQDLPQEVLANSMTELFSQTWPRIEQLIQTAANDQEIIEACCDFLMEIFMFQPEMDALFCKLQQCLLTCFVQNPKSNTKCLQTYAEICLKLSKKSQQVKNQVLQTMDNVCDMLLPIIIKPQEANKAFIDRIDTEVVSAASQFFVKLLQIEAEPFILSKNFEPVMQLFTQICVNVNEQELTAKVVTFFQLIIEKTNGQKQQLSQQAQEKVVKLYLSGDLINALISVIPYEKNKQVISIRVSQCFVFIYCTAERMGHDLNFLGNLVVQAFDQTTLLRTVPQNIRKIVAKVLLVFYNKVQTLRLLFQTLKWFVAGEVGEDSFLGMELQAQQRINERQNSSIAESVIQI